MRKIWKIFVIQLKKEVLSSQLSLENLIQIIQNMKLLQAKEDGWQQEKQDFTKYQWSLQKQMT